MLRVAQGKSGAVRWAIITCNLRGLLLTCNLRTRRVLPDPETPEIGPRCPGIGAENPDPGQIGAGRGGNRGFRRGLGASRFSIDQTEMGPVEHRDIMMLVTAARR
jgi:hypothetical protein